MPNGIFGECEREVVNVEGSADGFGDGGIRLRGVRRPTSGSGRFLNACQGVRIAIDFVPSTMLLASGRIMSRYSLCSFFFPLGT